MSALGGRSLCWGRAGILLEVMLALAILVMSSIVLLGVAQQADAGLLRAQEEQRAMDLARSALALIEAGVQDAQALSGPVPEFSADAVAERRDGADAGGPEPRGGADASLSGDAGAADVAPDELMANEGLRFGAEAEAWHLEVEAEPSEFPGLTTVRVTAFRSASGRVEDAAVRASVEQLVRLRVDREDAVGDENELEDDIERLDRRLPDADEEQDEGGASDGDGGAAGGGS